MRHVNAIQMYVMFLLPQISVDVCAFRLICNYAMLDMGQSVESPYVAMSAKCGLSAAQDQNVFFLMLVKYY